MAYVYSHIRKDTGECFYIGKGSGYRMNSRQARNPHWNNIVEKAGYEIIILVNNISDKKALELEKDFISQIGMENLANYHEGGVGGGDLTNARKKANTPAAKRKRVASMRKFWKKNGHPLKGTKRSPEVIEKLKQRTFTREQIDHRMKVHQENAPKYIEVNTGFVGTRKQIKQQFNNVDMYYYLKTGPTTLKDGTKFHIQKYDI